MVEIRPKMPSLAQILPSWKWLLWASAVLLILVVAGYVGLRFYLTQLHNEVVDLNNQIKEAAAQVNIQDEQTILRFNDSLNVIRSLFSNHAYFSSLFGILHGSTYPKLSYRSVQVDVSKNLIQLQGKTQSYTSLAKQIIALRNISFVKGVDVSGIVFAVDGLQFGLKIEVNPDIFRQQK